MTSVRSALPSSLGSPAALIDGRVVEAGDEIPVRNPFSDNVIGVTHQATAETVDEAVIAARSGFRAWSAVDVTDRAALLRRTAELLEERGPSIADTVTAEMGMPTTLAVATQQVMPAAVLRSMSAAAERFPWREQIDGATLQRVSAGVVAAITPWNMPVHQIVAKVAAALAAGCSVVLKPAEATPFDAALIRQCFVDAGLPPAAFNIVNGTGPVTGTALAGHPGVAHVSFTGSVGAGKSVAAAAAGSLTRTTLELGGKSPAVVLPDADFERVLPRVLASGLVNTGQACNATTRILAPRAATFTVEAALAQALSGIVVGDPTESSTTHGPLASRRQTERVLEHAALARATGRVVAGTGEQLSIGGSRCFVEPLIVTDLGPDSRTVREEIFGPVLVVQYYDSVAEAIELANDCDYGLSAEVWSASSQHATEVAGLLDVGQVKVNGVKTRERPGVPFGGVKNSGYGRELGATGLAEFTEIKAVMA
ncbi:aldehyde dehydrogenase family protein [Aldersonia sp. NBC_00410]|uniref:aldehyde dehydrogenase family protein n=1 Tax=Aldersonia sp. NBC_00410 TaxID=2975954 RepID=UPI00225952F7|nr:aldehyde dehydrogenase family protein [Aldersonia sp. NBC_00410]MCX5046367.1 aldehyde dehydrogenase family protein [Aldersonia sp. NBC_00410]